MCFNTGDFYLFSYFAKYSQYAQTKTNIEMFLRNNEKIFRLKIFNDLFAIKRFYWQFDRDNDGLNMSLKTGGCYIRFKKKFNVCILYIQFFFSYNRVYYIHFYKYIYVYVHKLKI